MKDSAYRMLAPQFGALSNCVQNWVCEQAPFPNVPIYLIYDANVRIYLIYDTQYMPGSLHLTTYHAL